jgi:hypothetical protein
MKIKDDDEKEYIWWTKSRHALYSLISTGSKWKFLILLFIFVILVIIIIAGFSLSLVAPTESGTNLVVNTLYRLNIEPTSVSYVLHGVKSENIRIPGHVVQGWLARPEHISINIKNNDFQWLSRQRDTALAQGIWTGSNETVPATIRFRDEDIKVDVRLKGNSIEHWGTDAWSLKVKTDGNDRLFGMREFSIEKPVTRRYLTEWVFHRLLTYENIPHLQFSFASVDVNGRDMGIYAIEEAPDDRLLDAEGYPAGPIFHMNDEIWQARAAGYTINDTPTVPIQQYNPDRYNSSDRELQVRKGQDLFEAFRDGTLSATEAFDTRTLTTFMALSDLTGNRNGNYASNIRPYFNPVTGKLELIGNDAKTEPLKNIFYLDNRQFNQLISKDPGVVQLYVHELERVSSPEYLDHFFSVIETEFEQNLSFMYKENPFYHFPREIYERNQEKIRQTIYPFRCQYSYLENVTGDGVVYIEAGAAQPMPVEVLGLRVNGKLLPLTGGPRILPGTNAGEVTSYHLLSFNLSDDVRQVTATDNLTLECRVWGTTPVRSETVIGKARLSDWPPGEDIVRRQPNPEQFSWLNRDDTNLTFTIQPGKWVIDKDLIIPEGYTVITSRGGGTRLDLTRGAMILSYSPLHLTGDEDYPFEVTSSDGTGQGILVLTVKNSSVLSYVRMGNLSMPDRNGWKIPASVTFYQSAVVIDHSGFMDGEGQGSLLSIVRGTAKISDSCFMRSRTDLLTSLFSSVEIADTCFIGPASGGISGTGSILNLQRINLDGTFGIGIRGMRGSDITLGNSYISNARVAGTAEDGSKMSLDGCSINSSIVGLAAYRNTPGYGPGTIVAENVQFVRTETPYLTEKESSIRIGKADALPGESQVFRKIKDITGIPL